MDLRARLADLATKELGVISNLATGGMRYYPEDKIVELVESLRLDKDLIKARFNEQ